MVSGPKGCNQRVSGPKDPNEKVKTKGLEPKEPKPLT